MEEPCRSIGFVTITCLKPITKLGNHDSIWAWHFLRINPEYIEDWNKHSALSHFHIQEQLSIPWRQYNQSKVDQKASKWGLHGWINPISDGEYGTPLFWNIMPTLDISLVTKDLNQKFTTLNQILKLVKKRKGDIAGLALLDGDLILRIRIFEIVFQIRVNDGGNQVDLEKNIKVEFILDPLFRIMLENLRIIARSLYPYQTNNTRVDPDSLLMAIDQKFHGKTRKQIAIAVFGQDRVESEWNESKTFRDLIYYRLKLAQDIVQGDYKDYASGKRSFYIRS